MLPLSIANFACGGHQNFFPYCTMAAAGVGLLFLAIDREGNPFEKIREQEQKGMIKIFISWNLFEPSSAKKNPTRSSGI